VDLGLPVGEGGFNGQFVTVMPALNLVVAFETPQGAAIGSCCRSTSGSSKRS
jgi:hypothetical protein